MQTQGPGPRPIKVDTLMVVSADEHDIDRISDEMRRYRAFYPVMVVGAGVCATFHDATAA